MPSYRLSTSTAMSTSTTTHTPESTHVPAADQQRAGLSLLPEDSASQ